MALQTDCRRAFTLIELSIVLVIIGLIVGGVLVGRDLIGASAVRAQLQQIEKFNTSANTFRDKYGYLPGDIPDPDATRFGFEARMNDAGRGDGNGTLEGRNTTSNTNGYFVAQGETATFWTDLSTAKLIEGQYRGLIDSTVFPEPTTATSIPPTNQLLPEAKIGNGNHIYVFSNSSQNYFGLSSPIQITSLYLETKSGLTVQQAYNMDTKVDDGIPITGRVLARQIYLGIFNYAPNNTSDTSTTCYNSATSRYSLASNGGRGTNCSLVFRFQ